jgi:predicted dehydrogenase
MCNWQSDNGKGIMMSSQTLNIAVIGLGMGQSHINGYKNCPNASVAAICDTNDKRLADAAQKFAIPADRCYTDWKKLLSEAKKLGLSGVSVALPNFLHAPVTLAAFGAGLHVLCEKPMAMSARQAKAMLDASRKSRKKLMINFSYRFTEQSQALKRYVDGGSLGDIYFGRTVWHRRRGLPGLGGWFGIKEFSGGGPIIDLGVHRLDLVMWLMGNPRPLTVSGSTFGVVGPRLAKEQGKKFDVEDLGCALIRFDNGATIILEASWAGLSEKAEDQVTQLWATRGGIIQRNINDAYQYEARVYTESHGTLWETRLQQTTTPTPSACGEFIDAILENREPSASGQHGLDVQNILDAIYKSSATGKEIKIAR